MKISLGTKITAISLALLSGLIPSACSSLGYDSAGNPITSLNVSNNFTGPQGATGATGPNGTSFNTSGNTSFSSYNITLNGGTTGGTWTWASLRFFDVIITQGWNGFVAFRNLANTAYANLEVMDLNLDGVFRFQVSTGAGLKPADGLLSGNYYSLYAHNDTSNTSFEVARVEGGLSTNTSNQGRVNFLKVPKFSVQNVTGPSNNVTPVTWIPVLLTDNTTAYMAAYK